MPVAYGGFKSYIVYDGNPKQPANMQRPMRTLTLKAIVPMLFILQLMMPFSARAELPLGGFGFEAGPHMSWFSYDEPGVMEESGLMYGVSGVCSYRADNLPAGIDMLRLEAMIARGEVDYSSSGSGDLSGIDERMYEIRLLASRHIVKGLGSTLSWYTGIAYRRLDDSSGGMVSTRGYCGYDRHSNYWYSPIGMELVARQGAGLSISGTLEYDAFWGGKQVSELTDANNAVYTYSDDLENSQSSGYGLRAALMFRQELGFGAMSFGPFFRYWNIDRSDVDAIVVTENGVQRITGFVEPDNNSSEYGMAVSISF
jgi:hypothetical protein